MSRSETSRFQLVLCYYYIKKTHINKQNNNYQNFDQDQKVEKQTSSYQKPTRFEKHVQCFCTRVVWQAFTVSNKNPHACPQLSLNGTNVGKSDLKQQLHTANAMRSTQTQCLKLIQTKRTHTRCTKLNSPAITSQQRGNMADNGNCTHATVLRERKIVRKQHRARYAVDNEVSIDKVRHVHTVAQFCTWTFRIGVFVIRQRPVVTV